MRFKRTSLISVASMALLLIVNTHVYSKSLLTTKQGTLKLKTFSVSCQANAGSIDKKIAELDKQVSDWLEQYSVNDTGGPISPKSRVFPQSVTSSTGVGSHMVLVYTVFLYYYDYSE